MNTFKKITLTSAVAFALFAFNACGDDSGSTSASGENSTLSSAVEDDESSSSINGDSSSSVTPGSDRESSSSSSVKADGKSSSSINDVGSSSSVVNVGLCSYGTCDEEDEIVSISGYGRTYFICKNGCYEEIVRESSSSSSSKYPVMDSVFNSQLSYGEFKDPRDGQVYKTRMLTLRNEQKIEVFAQNLNYGRVVKEGDEIVDGDTVKYCHDDDEWYCDHYYGGMYTWADAMGFPYACNYHKTNTAECPFKLDDDDYGRQYRGICPEGWHITNKREWAVGIVAGRADLSVSKYSGGVDAAGLSILLNETTGTAYWFTSAILDGHLQENDSLVGTLKFHVWSNINTGVFNDTYKDGDGENSGKYVPNSKHRSIMGVRCTRDYIYEN